MQTRRSERRGVGGKPAWGLGLCLAGLLMAACRSGGESPAASAVHDPVIRDIPKPAGFKLVDKNTQAVAAGQYRIAKCEYRGDTDRAGVKRFYEEYMPSAGFTLRQWSLDKGTYLLNFESNSELCVVKIGQSGWRTVINIEVVPKPQGPAERDNPPPVRRAG